MGVYKVVAIDGYSKRVMVPEEEVQKIASTISRDGYCSWYDYTDEHYAKYKETNSVAGFTGVTTKNILFDIDMKDNLEGAKESTLKLIDRLKADGIPESSIDTYFSSNKGFHVEIHTNETMTPEEHKTLAVKYASDIEGFDSKVYDSQRILRLPKTINVDSGLYKIPVTHWLLKSKTAEEIKELAKNKVSSNRKIVAVDLPEKMVKMKEVEFLRPTAVLVNKDPSFMDIASIDWSSKPKEWKDYKWALLQGYFSAGDRHNALMVIAATCRALGYDKTTTYYMCKAALKKQAELTGQDEFDKSELYKNIIEKSVFGASWNGGQYSIVTDAYLQKYCKEMGFNHKGESPGEEHDTFSIGDVFDSFIDYAYNLDKLTVKFGIPDLDKAVRITVGMSVGLIGAPGSGKTSLALAALNFMSKAGEQCIFFSYDMYHAIVYQKLVSKFFNLNMDTILLKLTGKKTVYKEDYEHRLLEKDGRKILESTEFTSTFDFSDKLDKEFSAKINKMINEEFANVEFCFTSGQSTEDIEQTVLRVEQKTGKKVRFIVNDYNELVTTDLQDPTASSNYVAQKMREISIKHSLCALQLFQPTKLTGTPADEIKSYHSAKGGGGIAQSVALMLTMSRPGYSPDSPENDKFARINIVKQRMGSLGKVDLGFHGLTGNFTSLSFEEKEHLRRVLENKEKEDKAKGKGEL